MASNVGPSMLLVLGGVLYGTYVSSQLNCNCVLVCVFREQQRMTALGI